MIVWHTIAHRHAVLHQAQPTIAALRLLTPLQLLLAPHARKSLRTRARKVRQLIDANRPIAARRLRALVVINLAVFALPTDRTATRVLHATAVDALAAVQTEAAHARLADGHVDLAVQTEEAGRALTLVTVLLVHTEAAIQAGIGEALVDVHFAVGAWCRKHTREDYDL